MCIRDRDYIIVRYFEWGVAGVAWATFIAQGIACILAVRTVVLRLRDVPTEGQAPLFSMPMLCRICLLYTSRCV